MSQSKNNLANPRSMRQKRILDIAAKDPDLSVEEIAVEVPSATSELVKRVLDEYGDPANEQSEEPSASEAGSTIEGALTSNSDQLSSEQCELLRLIYEHPDASQRELGEILDVSRTTVSNRANSIDGFEWKNRLKFVESIFETDSIMTGRGNSGSSVDESNYEHQIETIQNRVLSLEQQIDQLTFNRETGSILGDPELIHKVLHACLESETITNDEELQLLKMVLD